MTRSADEKLRITTEDVVWREVGDEVVVLHIATATYLTINGSGRVLWARLADGATSDELAHELVERYRIDRDLAARDVDTFLRSLQACRLLGEPTGGAGPG